MTDTEEKRTYRSVSQLQQFEKCPQAWYLSRVKKVWQRPAAWLGQGSAVHEAAEAFEKSNRTMTLEEAQAVFTESYDRHINEACETTPNFDWWFRSGPYAGQRDIERRYGIGLEQVEKYITWALGADDRVIWIAPDGTPGIEIGFEFQLDDIWIRGFIDQVSVVGDEVEVVDVKTGNSPGDDFQLGVYGLALAEVYGIEQPQSGAYWMGKSGKLTYPYKIGEWTRERVAERFRQLEQDIAAERFEAKPEPSKCRFCSVAVSCDFRVD